MPRGVQGAGPHSEELAEPARGPPCTVRLSERRSGWKAAKRTGITIQKSAH